MKAVIPCAGEGVRMRPLTLRTPKQLLEVGGKPILVHIFENLPDEIDEVILVVGYLGDKIREYFLHNTGESDVDSIFLDPDMILYVDTMINKKIFIR